MTRHQCLQKSVRKIFHMNPEINERNTTYVSKNQWETHWFLETELIAAALFNSIWQTFLPNIYLAKITFYSGFLFEGSSYKSVFTVCISLIDFWRHILCFANVLHVPTWPIHTAREEIMWLFKYHSNQFQIYLSNFLIFFSSRSFFASISQNQMTSQISNLFSA